jgi:hypothetical protein
MNALLCLIVVLAPAPAPLVIDDDVFEFPHRGFQIPVTIQPSRRHEVRSLQLYVSSDHGKTWKFHN